MARAHADLNAIPHGWRTRQPGFILWILFTIPRALLLVLLHALYFIPQRFRQHPRWTYRQSLVTWIIKFAFGVITELGYSQSLNLKPGRLGNRWVVIDPVPMSVVKNAYYGPFSPGSVKPERIGGTWYPESPSLPTFNNTSDYDGRVYDGNTSNHPNQSIVVLSFHSGSFLWTTGRPIDSGTTANLLNQNLGSSTRSLWVQYRLAGGNNPTPYPGAMQDAITAYSYLINDLKISPQRIVLAGDSSGATIALALLRYLALMNDQRTKKSDGNPSSDDYQIDEKSWNYLKAAVAPRACLLFSPSVEYTVEGDAHDMNTHRNSATDYCEGHMAAWGTAAFAPPDKMRLDDPYMSPLLSPFATPVPLFVQAGGAEIAVDGVKAFAEAMQQVGNKVEYLETPHAPHDVYIVGHVAGWKAEQESVIGAAADFVRKIN